MSLTTQECKKIIGDLMTDIVRGIDTVTLADHYDKTGDDLSHLMSPDYWKRLKKTGKKGFEVREFCHDLIVCNAIIRSAITPDGTPTLMVDLTGMPQIIQDKAKTANVTIRGFGVPEVKDLTPQTSMKDTPKPEGYGAFA